MISSSVILDIHAVYIHARTMGPPVMVGPLVLTLLMLRKQSEVSMCGLSKPMGKHMSNQGKPDY